MRCIAKQSAPLVSQAWPCVEIESDDFEFALAVYGLVRAIGQVLAQQSVRVLDGRLLPVTACREFKNLAMATSGHVLVRLTWS